MADNITAQSSTLATIPDSTVIATDDSGGAHYQIIEIADATTPTQRLGIDSGGRPTVKISDGTDTLAIAADGSIAVTGSFTTSVNKVTGTATSSGLTTATTLYAAGDQMGDLEELTNMAAASGGSGYISTARLLCDVAGVIGGVRVWVFSGSVSLNTDNSVFTLSDADALKVEGIIDFGTPQSASNNAFVQALNVNLDYTCDATSLYVAFQTLSAHVAHFAAADDLHLELVAYRQ